LPIKAVIFDLDETLIPEQASDDAALAAVCELVRERREIDPSTLAAAVRRHARELWVSGPSFDYCRAIGIASWEGLWGEFSGGDANLGVLSAWAPEYRLEAWRRALIDHRIDDDNLARELAGRLIVERRRTHRVFPDTVTALEELGGAISARPHHQRRARCSARQAGWLRAGALLRIRAGFRRSWLWQA